MIDSMENEERLELVERITRKLASGEVKLGTVKNSAP